jgi:hypothetical protein
MPLFGSSLEYGLDEAEVMVRLKHNAERKVELETMTVRYQGKKKLLPLGS